MKGYKGFGGVQIEVTLLIYLSLLIYPSVLARSSYSNIQVERGPYRFGDIMSDADGFVRVYSYRRSGTNLLCAYLFKNFYEGTDMWRGAETRSGPDLDMNKMFYDDEGQISSRNKWAILFGGHGVEDLTRADVDRSIYLYRNEMDTARSLYRFHDSLGRIEDGMKFKDWMRRYAVKESIRVHHRIGLGRLFSIRYEDLTGKPERTMERIAEWFGLEPVRDNWVLIRNKVGWNPGPAVRRITE